MMYVVPQWKLERALFFKWTGVPLLLVVWVCWVPELVWIRSGWEEPAGLKGKKRGTCTRYRGNASDFITKPATPQRENRGTPSQRCCSESSTFPAHRPTHLAFLLPAPQRAAVDQR
ncbi:hypothetical protein QBC41DRAFT_8994 [Cercophora samala]|uniref:Uncharacterized protein n=1 Tax=Cercophora samala TaxID=330535 RepID=A0AA39Z921_9PEZI|nr:hypothetical protein QBC41DRAFT_8994 [Cercophora samala]